MEFCDQYAHAREAGGYSKVTVKARYRQLEAWGMVNSGNRGSMQGWYAPRYAGKEPVSAAGGA